jgi:hypothetical protein
MDMDGVFDDQGTGDVTLLHVKRYQKDNVQQPNLARYPNIITLNFTIIRGISSSAYS